MDAGGDASKKIPVEMLVNVKLLVWMLVDMLSVKNQETRSMVLSAPINNNSGFMAGI